MSLRKLAVVALFGVVAGGAEAQVSRVFVSVTGNDANVCSNIATPCRTLGGGITQVDAAGEVIVIDSGSYAGGTITKSVKINVAAGAVAFSGVPIVVNPGTGGTVVLRGLTLKAATQGSGTGITQQSGTLFLENTVVDGWNTGLTANPGVEQLFVKASVFRNHGITGLFVNTGGTALVTIDGSFFENNEWGLALYSGTGRVSNTVMSANDYGAQLRNSGTAFTFHRCEVSGNTIGGLVAYVSSVLRVGQSTLTENGTGLYNAGGGATVESFGDNVIRANTADVSGTVTTVALR